VRQRRHGFEGAMCWAVSSTSTNSLLEVGSRVCVPFRIVLHHDPISVQEVVEDGCVVVRLLEHHVFDDVAGGAQLGQSVFGLPRRARGLFVARNQKLHRRSCFPSRRRRRSPCCTPSNS